MPKVESKWDKSIFYALSALVFILPLAFTPFTYISFEPVKLAVLRVFSILLIALLVLKYFDGDQISVVRSRLTLPLFSLSILLLVSTIFSLNIHTSLWGELYRYEGLITNLNYFFLFCMGLSFPGTKRIEGLLKIWLASATIVAIYGLLQHFGVDFLPWNTASMDVSRSFSTFGNAVFLGAYLALAIPLALGLAFFMRAKPVKERSWAWVIPLLIAFFLLLVLIFTYSRGALLSLLIAVLTTSVLLGFSDKRNSRSYVVLALALLLIVVLTLGLSSYLGGKSLFESLRISTDGSIGTRFLLWEGSIKAVSKRPLLGFGPDTFKLVFPSVRPQEWFSVVKEVATPDKAHNELLQTAVGAGLPGLMAYLWVMVTYFLLSATMMLRAKSWQHRILLAGFFGGTLAYFLQLQFAFSVISVSPLFWLSLGFAEALGRPEGAQPRRIRSFQGKRRNLWVGYLTAAVLIGSGIFMVSRPVAAEVFARRAYMSRSAGLWPETARDLEEAISLNGSEDIYHLRLGDVYLAQWKTGNRESKEKALVAFLTAQSLNPWNEKVYFYLGEYYRLRGKVDGIYWHKRAEDAYQKLLVLDPHNSEAYADLGLTYADTQYYEKAIKAWEKGTKLDSRQTSLFYNMARAYELDGKYHEAVIYYQKVLALEPNNTYAYESVRRLKVKAKE